jgi:murein DD-endopeptidase MepM/ murein hydrolase activator NlpD
MTNAYKPGPQFRPRSSYGNRIDPITGNNTEFHAGQDFAASAGTPIPSAASGTVVYSGLNKGFGNVVIIKNDAGGYSLYGHMQGANQPGFGQRVWRGDTIGLVGNTGRSTGYHLHYSVITNDAGENIKGTTRMARSASRWIVATP